MSDTDKLVVTDSLADFLEVPKESLLEEEKPEQLEEQKKDPVVTPKEVVPEEKPGPKVDTEELTKKIKQEITDELVEKLSPKEQKQVDELMTEWEKRGSNPKDYKEIVVEAVRLAKEQTLKEIKQQQAQEQEAAKKAQEESQQKAEENKKQWNQYWDTQIETLTKEGKLPAVVDANNPEDPGIAARNELFKTAYDNNTTDLELTYYKHFQNKSTKKKVAGEDAPINTGRKSAVPDENKGFSYKDIANKSFEQIFYEAQGR